MKTKTQKIFFAIGVLLIPISGAAQFSKYWNESFSTKAALLAGAVVGGYQDETSIYYNPAILSDSSVSQLSFANGLAKLEGVKYDDALCQNQSIGDWTSTVSPSFFSVNLYPKDKLGLVWKASVFNKSRFDRTVRSEYQEQGGFIPVIPGNEMYLGKVSNRTEYKDYWYGVGIAKFLNDRFSLGLSLFARYSSLTYDASKSVQLNGADEFSDLQKVAYNRSTLYLYGYTWRATVKMGANYRVSERLRVGLVITAPSVSVMGRSRSEKSVTNTNIPNSATGDIMPDNLYDATAEDLPFTLKDPISIALGIDFHREKFRVNITGEFYGPISPYKMVDQRGGDTRLNMVPGTDVDNDYLSYVAGAKPIVNLAVGLEIFQTNKKSFLFGFKTDFDALKNYYYGVYNNLNTIDGANSNYYHVSSGKSFEFLKYDVLFGLQYSFSRAKNLQAFANFTPTEIVTNPDHYSLEGPSSNTMSFSGNTITLFVALTIKK